MDRFGIERQVPRFSELLKSCRAAKNTPPHQKPPAKNVKHQVREKGPPRAPPHGGKKRGEKPKKPTKKPRPPRLISKKIRDPSESGGAEKKANLPAGKAPGQPC